MLQISADLSELEKLITKLEKIDSFAANTIWDGLFQVSVDTEKEIKGDMPVDTGRAKAGWGRYTPQDLQNKVKMGRSGRRRRWSARGASGRIQISSESDAIWEEDKENLQITQGTNVPYTKYINAGSAGRAGTHHIDMASLRQEIRMSKWLIQLSEWFIKNLKK